MAKFALNRNNSGDLGFAVSSLVYCSVTFAEFKDWIYYVIEHEDVDDIPAFFFEVLDIKDKFDFTGRRLHIIGFYPSWDGGDDEDDALCGIGFRRFPDLRMDGLTREDALAALARNPHIEERFRKTFPFIDF